jgi:hypothetical protein
MSMETNERSAAFLDAAADHIERHGHWKGAAQGPDRQACFYGALGAVVPLDCYAEISRPIVRAMAEELGVTPRTELLEQVKDKPTVLRVLWSGVGVSITRWNDHPDREPSEVIDRMRFAAKRLRGGA